MLSALPSVQKWGDRTVENEKRLGLASQEIVIRVTLVLYPAMQLMRERCRVLSDAGMPGETRTRAPGLGSRGPIRDGKDKRFGAFSRTETL